MWKLFTFTRFPADGTHPCPVVAAETGQARPDGRAFLS